MFLAAAIGAAGLTLISVPASAQSLFENLFSGFVRPAAASQASAYAPSATAPAPTVVPDASAGRGVTYCVRVCDGRYFPMQRHASASPAQLCSSLCPASRTKVFAGGSDIEHTAGPGGERYADLANAYLYRKKIVADCTCNGRDAFGLAHLDVASDPTLQPGDMVATGHGVITYSGNRTRNTVAQSGPYTPARNPAARDRIVTGSVD